ncbi:MAG: DNA-processing protein DprA [Pseudomonadota bacterium]
MAKVSAIALARLTKVPYLFRKYLIDRAGGSEALVDGILSGRTPDPERPEWIQMIRLNLDLAAAEREERRIAKSGAWVRVYGDGDYPEPLAQIPDPPLVIMGRGEYPKGQEARFLSVVGPRRPSTYGARVGRMLAKDLVREGLILVSGMARGIDAIAHEACVEAKTPTIAVLGCGIDRTYPPEHALLRSKIEKTGCVITEFFPGEPPRPGNFPMRNRIIAGLSKATLVIEAGEKSGARITARHALDQGRDVFAVPGPVDAPLSMFTNRLISEGGKLVATSADVLEEYFPGRSFAAPVAVQADLAGLSDGAKEIFGYFAADLPMGVDDLVGKGGWPASDVLSSLLELELRGLVERGPDSRYVRVAV